jgi:hypothetical protein
MVLANQQPLAHLFTISDDELRKRSMGQTPGIGHKAKHHKQRKFTAIEPVNKNKGQKK